MSKLKTFPTIIPAIQSSKILELLEEQRKDGELSSKEEFESALQSSLLKINPKDGEYIPISGRVFIRPGLSSSKQFNYQLSQLRRDMDVIALELANIQSVIKAHSDLFQDKYVDQIKYSISDLKSKIDNLQVVRTDIQGFQTTLFNTFSDLGDLLSRNDALARELYQDLRQFKFIEDREIAFLDRNSESLTLPLKVNSSVPFLNVEIDPTDSTISEVDIDLPDSGPSNILDEELGTFWYHNILTKTILADGAKLTLDFDLGDKKEINYLVLQSVSDFPMYIDSLSYVDDLDIVQPLQTDLSDRILSGSRKFIFDTITMQRVILKLKQFNFGSIGIDLNRPSLTLDDLKRDSSLTPHVSILADSVDSNVEDPAVKNTLALSNTSTESLKVFNHYVFAIDNVYAGNSAYSDNGYFISKAFDIRKLGQLSLKISQDIPTFFDADLDDTFKSGSVEYDLVKRDFNTKGDFIRSNTFPLLPLGNNSVADERLFFTPRYKTISLRFPGHTVGLDGSGVSLFRNNKPLIRGVDWRFANRATVGDNSDSILAVGSRDTLIEILHDDNIILTGKYTANYTPQHISSPDSNFYFDTEQTILCLPSNNIEFKLEKLFEIPEVSQIFLKISIRNNSFLDSLAPKINFYKLFVSSL